MSEQELTYKASGVDIDAQDEALAGVKRLAKATFTPGVLSEIGLFGGLFAMRPEDPDSDVLVISSVSPSPVATPELANLSYPIAGACLPSGDQLMPSASRPYRQGIHEGIDFYDSDNCTAIGFDTEVLAAKDGRVIRADSDYEELTQAEVDEIDARIAAQGKCDEDCLDTYRGRQVWIDHGAGVVTRYAHLSRVADGLQVGMSVRRGEVIGYVGNSGTPESLIDPNAEIHLHLEIRVGDSYLGQGLTPEEVRALYESAFAQ